MKIDEKGYKLSSIDNILTNNEKQLQKKFGTDFYVKPEGVIDNIANALSVMEQLIQNQIAFLAKQFDPKTAEGIWQNALYQRIGLTRIDDKPTKFTKKIKGTAGYAGSANTIFICSSLSGYEYTNTSAYTFDEEGNADIEFECVVSGSVAVNAGESFTIVECPAEVMEISSREAEQITIGRERESDRDFRARFYATKSQNARGTRNANLANLGKYVDNMSYLRIDDIKSDNTIPAGRIRIIAKHNTTDEIFAEAIFDTVLDGLDFIGDTTVIVKDSEGMDVPISWKNADEVPIDITAGIKIRKGNYPNTVKTNVKQKIIEYIKERIYGLETSIYATEFIIPTLEVEGVEAVMDIKVKKSTDTAFSESVSLTREQVPAFVAERITLNESD